MQLRVMVITVAILAAFAVTIRKLAAARKQPGNHTAFKLGCFVVTLTVAFNCAAIAIGLLTGPAPAFSPMGAIWRILLVAVSCFVVCGPLAFYVVKKGDKELGTFALVLSMFPALVGGGCIHLANLLFSRHGY